MRRAGHAGGDGISRGGNAALATGAELWRRTAGRDDPTDDDANPVAAGASPLRGAPSSAPFDRDRPPRRERISRRRSCERSSVVSDLCMAQHGRTDLPGPHGQANARPAPPAGGSRGRFSPPGQEIAGISTGFFALRETDRPCGSKPTGPSAASNARKKPRSRV